RANVVAAASGSGAGAWRDARGRRAAIRLPAEGLLRRRVAARAERSPAAPELARPPARRARVMGDRAGARRFHRWYADLLATPARGLRKRGGGSRSPPSHGSVARRAARRRVGRHLSSASAGP